MMKPHFIWRPYTLLLLLQLALVATSAGGCHWGKDDEKTNPNNPAATDANGLPHATQEGKQTFGALINGKPFRNSLRFRDMKNLYALLQNENGVPVFNIACDNPERDTPTGETSIGFRVPVPSSNKFPIRFSVSNIYENRGKYASVGVTTFNSDLSKYHEFIIGTDSGYVEITKLDMDKRIIAGRFAYTATNTKGNNIGEKVIVTDGRFDLVYLITE